MQLINWNAITGLFKTRRQNTEVFGEHSLVEWSRRRVKGDALLCWLSSLLSCCCCCCRRRRVVWRRPSLMNMLSSAQPAVLDRTHWIKSYLPQPGCRTVRICTGQIPSCMPLGQWRGPSSPADLWGGSGGTPGRPSSGYQGRDTWARRIRIKGCTTV